MRCCASPSSTSGTDTGRQRRANEDSLLARAPLFVVADGMGGAQAGEVASRIAIESFQHGLDDTDRRRGQPRRATRARRTRSIHELSQADAEHAGMGTTLTAVYVGERGGRDRARRRQPRLLPARRRAAAPDRRPLARRRADPPGQAHARGGRRASAALGDHARARARSRRSRSTRAPTAPAPATSTCSAATVSRRWSPSALLAEILLAHRRLRDAGEALIAAANEAGGRDNITVVLLRLEEVAVAAHALADDHAHADGHPGVAGERRGRRDAARDGGRARPRAAGAPPATLAPPVARAASAPRRPAPATSPAPSAPPRTRRVRLRRASRRGRARGAGPDRRGRVPGLAVGLLHRHEQPRPGDAVQRLSLRTARRLEALQQRLRLRRAAPRR